MVHGQQQKVVERQQRDWRFKRIVRRGYAGFRVESTVRSLQRLDALDRGNGYMGRESRS